MLWFTAIFPNDAINSFLIGQLMHKTKFYSDLKVFNLSQEKTKFEPIPPKSLYLEKILCPMQKLVLIITLLSACLSIKAQKNFSQEGKASYYADKFEGRKTANGERYYHKYLTAAHKTLPMGTKLMVTNLENKKSIVIRVNDRGPYIKGRIIDLSKSAMIKLDGIQKGVIEVRIEEFIPVEKVQLPITGKSLAAPIPNENYPKALRKPSNDSQKRNKSTKPSFWKSLFK